MKLKEERIVKFGSKLPNLPLLTQQVRQKGENMKHRPEYHFLPEKNWMNDPNATIYFKGEHHLFYQYNPTDWHWGNLHYGHATSKDLLHWKHQPIALAPALDRGETHCYSGCSYINQDKIELLYTSVGAGKRCQHSGSQQWAATTEDGITWTQIKENPVIDMADSPEIQLTEWRDPFVFRWKEGIYALVAGVVNEEYGAVHLYKTEDFRKWTYVREFFRNTCRKEVMECPNLVVFGDKVLFVHSIWDVRVLRWFVGTLDEDMGFHVLNEGSVDYGDFFASQISFDETGRVLMWGWLREDPRRGLLTDGEWAGVQAIPRVVSVNEKNELVLSRLPEFEKLRTDQETVSVNDLSGEKYFDTKSYTAELTGTVISDDVFSIKLLMDETGREYTEIVFNPREGTYYAPMESSSLLKEVDKRPLFGAFEKNEEHKVEFDILIDCSVVEIFVNKTSCMSLRVYPVLEGNRISVETKGKIQKGEISVYSIAL